MYFFPPSPLTLQPIKSFLPRPTVSGVVTWNPWSSSYTFFWLCFASNKTEIKYAIRRDRRRIRETFSMWLGTYIKIPHATYTQFSTHLGGPKMTKLWEILLLNHIRSNKSTLWELWLVGSVSRNILPMTKPALFLGLLNIATVTAFS